MFGLHLFVDLLSPNHMWEALTWQSLDEGLYLRQIIMIRQLNGKKDRGSESKPTSKSKKAMNVNLLLSIIHKLSLIFYLPVILLGTVVFWIGAVACIVPSYILLLGAKFKDTYKGVKWRKAKGRFDRKAAEEQSAGGLIIRYIGFVLHMLKIIHLSVLGIPLLLVIMVKDLIFWTINFFWLREEKGDFNQVRETIEPKHLKTLLQVVFYFV